MTVTYNHKLGQSAEEAACQFLLAKGLRLLTRNFRCKVGEIDIIMQDQQEIVFVEVRVRNHPHFADGFDSVDYFKQQKIIKAATYFLCGKNWFDKVNCRFDVISISYAQAGPAMDWLKDAFTIDNY